LEPEYTAGLVKDRLFYRHWQPNAHSDATVIIVHGLGEQSGRYVQVGRFFSQRGFNTVAFDLRGHGRSLGKPCFVRSYDELLTDVREIVDRFRSERTYLLGHSWGGQVVLRAVQHGPLPLNGIIVSAPWLRLAFDPPHWQVALGRFLNDKLPSVRFPVRLDWTKLSHDKAHLDSLEDLDLGHRFITVRLYFETIKTGEAIIASPTIKLPIFMAQGTEDEVTSLPVNQSFFESLKAPSKTIRIYPGMRHELHNETDRIKVLTNYADWLERVSVPGS
jgi:alpha-beta hydrolase superfamily lysophospholipase